MNESIRDADAQKLTEPIETLTARRKALKKQRDKILPEKNTPSAVIGSSDSGDGKRSNVPCNSKQCKVEQKLTDTGNALNALKTLKSELNEFARRNTKINASITNAEKGLADNKDKTQSIPTPFGTFAVHPRFGLLLLAFASMSVYVAFTMKESQIVRLALDTGTRCDVSMLDMPFWLFPLDRRLPEEWRNQRGKVFAGIILQLGWLLLGTILVLECSRWDTHSPHWLGTLSSIYFALWVSIAIQGLYVISRVLRLLPPVSFAWITPLMQPMVTHLARREVLLWTASSSIVLLTGGVIWSKLARPRHLSTESIPYSKDLVVNAITGVIHHKRVCAGHLPKMANQRSITDVAMSVRFHASQVGSIYEALASISEADSATKYLEQAIQESPTRLHLYDRLVRIYGRHRRYEHIVPMLQCGLKYVRSRLTDSDVNSKQQTALKRAVAQFEARIECANRRVHSDKCA